MSDRSKLSYGAGEHNVQPEADSFLNNVAVLVLTYNEAPNIQRTLDALIRFPEVVVLDSGSTDDTVEISRRYPNVRIVTRVFDQHAAQWNFGLTDCGIERSWILALDADFVVPECLVDEISALVPMAETAGYKVAFRYFIFGKPLSAALYPALVVLYRRALTHYIQDGHTQRVVVKGRLLELNGRIGHDDRKPLSRWLLSQQNYARLEADYLIRKNKVALRWVDRIRLMGFPAPVLVFFYALLWKRCILGGWAGWFYVLQRTLSEIMIALEIIDRRLRNSK